MAAAIDLAEQRAAKPDLDGVLRGVTQELEALTTAARWGEGSAATPLRAARLAFLTTLLLELRDATCRLVRDGPSSRCVGVQVSSSDAPVFPRQLFLVPPYLPVSLLTGTLTRGCNTCATTSRGRGVARACR